MIWNFGSHLHIEAKCKHFQCHHWLKFAKSLLDDFAALTCSKAKLLGQMDHWFERLEPLHSPADVPDQSGAFQSTKSRRGLAASNVRESQGLFFARLVALILPIPFGRRHKANLVGQLEIKQCLPIIFCPEGVALW